MQRIRWSIDLSDRFVYAKSIRFPFNIERVLRWLGSFYWYGMVVMGVLFFWYIIEVCVP